MDIIEKISVFSSKLTIQYIHKDTPSLNKDRLLDLKNLFKKIYVSSGLEKGWKDYHTILMETKEYPDIIISDIELSQSNVYLYDKIFIENRNQIIIAISDFNKKEFLENYIDIGISYMVLEPVLQEQFNLVISRACEDIYHKKWNKKRRKEMEEQIEQMQNELNNAIRIVDRIIENNAKKDKHNNTSCKSIEEMSMINHDEGIKRMGGDENLYKELLEGFCTYYKDTVNKMKSALTENDFEALSTLAHGAKGASGNISAKYLYDISKDLEIAAKNNVSKLELFLMIKKFEKAFNSLCECVHNLFSK